MNPLTIILDVDSTIRNTPQAICDVYKENFDSNSKINPQDIISYDLRDIFPQILFVKDFFLNYSVDLFFNAKPCPNSAKVVQELYKNNFIYLVTDQPSEKEFLTEFWTRIHGTPYYELHCTPNKFLVKADVIVDDNPLILKKYKETHPKSTTVLINQSYNHGEGDFQVDPENLEELIPIIKSIKQR